MTEMTPTNQTIQLSEYRPHPRNYNRHPAAQVERIAHSLATFGQVRSVVVWRGTILAGHGVVEAARSLGWGELRADVLPDEYPEHLALAYVAADNELSRLSDPDLAQLASILDEAKQTDEELLRAIGYDDKEFEELLREVGADALGDNAGADTEPQIDKAEELRQKWGVETGQLWQMGEHRLICGDCTDAEVVARVMGGEKAVLSVTSPPYAVGKEYETGGVDEWRELIRNCFSVMLNCASDVWFVNLANRRTGNDGYEENTFGQMESEFRSMGVRLIGLRLWIKDPAWAGQNPYWLQTYKPVDDFEFLGIFAKQKPKHKKRLTDDEYRSWGWRGVWELSSVRANDLHSAMFPVEIPERAVKMMTDNGDLVYEPFSGSGTTIIACENLGRRCRAVEISPGYVAVALERWHQHTGKTPTLLE